VAQLPDVQLRAASGVALAEEDETVGLRYCPARGDLLSRDQVLDDGAAELAELLEAASVV
jgi:hypothetical protein